MKTHTFCFLFFLIFFGLHGQESVSENPLLKKTELVQKAHKRFQKEVHKLSRKYKKQLSAKWPAFSEDMLDSIMSMELAEKKEGIQKNAKDSVSRYFQKLRQRLLEDLQETPEKLPAGREIKEGLEALDKLEEYRTYLKSNKEGFKDLDLDDLTALNKDAEKLRATLETYKLEFEDWDKELLAQVTSMPQALKYQQEFAKIREYEALPTDYRKQLDQFQTNDFVKQQLEEKVEEFKQLGVQTLQERFDLAHEKMAEAKSKFPELESVKEAPKNYNPYKGIGFVKRLKLGGNIQIQPNEPLSVDAAFSLNYFLNQRISIGVEASSRLLLEKLNNMPKEGCFGLRAFKRYNVIGKFYLQANYELNRLRSTLPNEGTGNRAWHSSGLLGGGRIIPIKDKISLQISVLYDLCYDPVRSPNDGRWVSRIGFILN